MYIDKITILENDRVDKFNNIITLSKHLGNVPEIIVMDNLSFRDKSEILNAINESDTIGIQTTFIDHNQIKTFAKLFANITESKNIIFAYEHSESVLRDILSDENFYNVKHHRIFYTDGYEIFEMFFGDLYIKYQNHLNEIQENLKIVQNAVTGQKIIVKNIQAFGNAFATIKNGDILDVIDNSANDPNPSRGIWVWGNGEPVKLLKSDGYDEYDFYNETNEPVSIVESICNLISVDVNDINIAKVLGAINTKEYDVTINFGNLICDMFNIERRGNRTKINLLYEQSIQLV